ncbi:MAG TPA: phospho-N-acetylmuramoyl-pentapeptide-transferase [Oscillatoriaceae cyanobacterium]
MFAPLTLAVLLAFVLALALGRPMIGFLTRWKLGQIIREEGPESHKAKAGTPSMGGWIILIPALVAAAILTPMHGELLLLAFAILGNAFVGWLDDYLIVKKRSNKGLLPRYKMLGQLLVAGAFAGGLYWMGHGTRVLLPFTHGQGSLDLSYAYYALAIFIMVGTTNAVNLTDGLDGLCAGTVAIALLGLGLALYTYAHFATLPGALVLVAALIGGCLGYLWYNWHPAQVFMGDTGSLGLGGAVAGLAIVGHLELWLIPIGAVFIAETLCVMLQVAYFKRTGGKRLFKMSPLHHHFELSGWKETKVVGRFYLVGAAGALLAIALL